MFGSSRPSECNPEHSQNQRAQQSVFFFAHEAKTDATAYAIIRTLKSLGDSRRKILALLDL